MKSLNLITDGYDRKARLYPALLLLTPIVVTIIALWPATFSTLKAISATVVGCGGAFFLSQLARDAGKQREKTLFQEWGGLPSVAVFRHRDSRFDSITKARFHKKLASLVKGAKAPSASQEQTDPTGADLAYSAWSTYLRVNTRDTKKYPLVFRELVNYGFRRNLWGMRKIGITASAGAFLITSALCAERYRATTGINEELAGAATLALIFLLLWIFRFTGDWVRVPADAYAERLAEAADTIGGPANSPRKQ